MLTPAIAQETQPETLPDNQSGEPAVKHVPQPYGGGTPIDVIMHTKLWVDPPKMAPFVRAARPAPDTLNYTPTAGTEPKRPALRTATDLQKMEDELENAGARNEAAGGLKTRHFQALSVKKPKKTKTKRKL